MHDRFLFETIHRLLRLLQQATPLSSQPQNIPSTAEIAFMLYRQYRDDPDIMYAPEYIPHPLFFNGYPPRTPDQFEAIMTQSPLSQQEQQQHRLAARAKTVAHQQNAPVQLVAGTGERIIVDMVPHPIGNRQNLYINGIIIPVGVDIPLTFRFRDYLLDISQPWDICSLAHTAAAVMDHDHDDASSRPSSTDTNSTYSSDKSDTNSTPDRDTHDSPT